MQVLLNSVCENWSFHYIFKTIKNMKIINRVTLKCEKIVCWCLWVTHQTDSLKICLTFIIIALLYLQTEYLSAMKRICKVEVLFDYSNFSATYSIFFITQSSRTLHPYLSPLWSISIVEALRHRRVDQEVSQQKLYTILLTRNPNDVPDK